jgi:hypothetical protein
MAQKKSKVVKCVFSNEWKNPSGSLTYYHDVTLENGDTGSIGSMEKYSKKFTEGTIIDYTLENGKIKIITMENNSNQKNNNYQNNATKQGNSNYSNPRPTKQEQFLGYAWSYAKDLIVAGKNSDDLEELNKCARYIYDEIGKMLNNEQ